MYILYVYAEDLPTTHRRSKELKNSDPAINAYFFDRT